jgi:hypothetical protein
VKPGFYSILNPFMSNIAIILCFIPIILLWWKKLTREKAFLFACIYWLLNGLINLPDMIGQLQNSRVQEDITLLDNLVDTPLALLVFYYAASGAKKRMVLYFLIAFTVFELVVVLWKGHNFESSTIIIGFGIFVLFAYSFWRLAQYFQKIEHNAFENVMGFVYAGFIFYDGLWVVIYIFNYLNYKKETVQANQFLNYLSIILATILTSVGLWWFGRPKANLSKVYESQSR